MSQGYQRRRSRRARALPLLRSSQRRIARSDVRFKVVACGRRWGKTTLGIATAVNAALHGQQVWWVAPTYHLAYHPWRTFKRRFHAEWEEKIEYEKHIVLKSGGSIAVKTGEYGFGLRGHGLDLIIVDEAAFLQDEVWRAALRPALADKMGKALMISTPRGRNWFHESFLKGQDDLNMDWMSWTYPTATNPLIPEAEIAQAKRDLPEMIFQQEYEAMFLEASGMVFHNIETAAIAPLDTRPVPGRRYIMGVDFGRYNDFTVCVVIDADIRQMVAIDRFNMVNWGRQRERIAALAKKWDVWQVVAEANAMGEPNIEALRREGVRMRKFETTSTTKPHLIEKLVAAIENVDLTIMPDPTLLGELATFTYQESPRSMHTFYGAPPGYHDDTVMALALAWHEAARPRIALAVAVV